MILNNNCLPWQMSMELRKILNSHLSLHTTAVVISFLDRFAESSPVEIGVDVDGSIVMLSTPDGIDLKDSIKRLAEWDADFAARCLAGRFRVSVQQLMELEEEIVPVSPEIAISDGSSSALQSAASASSTPSPPGYLP